MAPRRLLSLLRAANPSHFASMSSASCCPPRALLPDAAESACPARESERAPAGHGAWRTAWQPTVASGLDNPKVMWDGSFLWVAEEQRRKTDDHQARSPVPSPGNAKYEKSELIRKAEAARPAACRLTRRGGRCARAVSRGTLTRPPPKWTRPTATGCDGCAKRA